MSQLDKLIVEIGLLQYKINNAELPKYAKKYQAERQRLERELFAAISQTAEDMSKRELEQFMAEITPHIIDSMRTIGKWESYSMPERLEEAYKGVYVDTAKAIGSGMKQSVTFDIVRLEMIEAALNNNVEGKNFSDRIWTNKAKLAERVYDSVYKHVRDGSDIRALSRELAKDFNTGTYEAMRLLQNETARVVSEAQDEIYKQSDVVQDVRFTATLDNSTTDICQSLDGTVFDKYDPLKPQIPQDTHINCRSCYVPEVAGWSPTVRRDNLNKKNVDYVKFKEYMF